MGKLGTYTYPDIGLAEAISLAERIARKFGGRISRAGLAAEVKMAEGGGGFIGKVGALKDYGLADGRTSLQLTDLAQRIIFPSSDEEAASARAQAFSKVELFARIHERTAGRMLEDDAFAIVLAEVAGSDRIAAKAKAAKIRKLYVEGAPLSSEGAIMPPGVFREPIAPGYIELTSGALHLKLPRTTDNIDILISALKVMKSDLERAPRATAEQPRNGSA